MLFRVLTGSVRFVADEFPIAVAKVQSAFHPGSAVVLLEKDFHGTIVASEKGYAIGYACRWMI